MEDREILQSRRNFMLASADVYPTLPVVDIKRAKQFYKEKLGLKVIMEDASPGVAFQVGRCSMLYLYQRGHTKADHTVASFRVDDLEAEVRALKDKGVKFEEYDIPQMGIKTKEGIATMNGSKAAWFKDTEGNILGLMQMAMVPDFYEQVRQLAYDMWNKEGRPAGKDWEYWFHAEETLTKR